MLYLRKSYFGTIKHNSINNDAAYHISLAKSTQRNKYADRHDKKPGSLVVVVVLLVLVLLTLYCNNSVSYVLNLCIPTFNCKMY